MSVVINHPKLGIYIGSCMGFGFWSKRDPCGQDCAVVFDSVVMAQSIVRSWDDHSMLPELSYVEVTPDIDNQWASITACVKAGLDAWDPWDLKKRD
jgi:hypothetical protein